MLGCKKCGAMREYDDAFCSVCGNRFPKLHMPQELPSGGRQYLIHNLCLDFDTYYFDMADMFIDIDAYFQTAYKEFVEYISRWLYFDSLFEQAIPYFLDTLGNVCASVHKWICIHGIYQISADDFISAAIKELPLEEDMGVFQTLADSIGEVINRVNNARAEQRSGRIRWSGGGFGVKGAIKGAITSGIMNWCSDMIHGIGDSRIDARDREKIHQLKVKMTKIINPKLYLSELFLKYFTEVANMGAELLAQTIPGCPEIFMCKPVTDALHTRIENLKALYMEGERGDEFLRDYTTSLHSNIVANPFLVYPYLDFIEIFGADSDHLKMFIEDMNMENIYETALKLRADRLVFDLEQDFSDMSISQKRFTVDALSRLVWGCGEFWNSPEQKRICNIYKEKVRNING